MIEYYSSSIGYDIPITIIPGFDPGMLSPQQLQSYKDSFDEFGYVIVPSLFSPAETDSLRDHYMALRASGAKEHDMVAETKIDADPLQKYPRMIHMHRWDKKSLEWMLDERINQCLTSFFGCPPLACQTMLYFKPPGARGQALHQDQYYLRVQPGTCMAAWMALDPTDEENGCMQVVPDSHRWPLLCHTKADPTKSFTNTTVPVPEEMHPVPTIMQAGDVLFFNGFLVHGSHPNTSTNRFRRSLIGHYINGYAEKVTAYDHPVLRMDGSTVEMGDAEAGGPCGIWVDHEGQPAIEMSGVEARGALAVE